VVPLLTLWYALLGVTGVFSFPPLTSSFSSRRVASVSLQGFIAAAQPPLTAEQTARWQEHASWLASTPISFRRKTVPNSNGALYGSLAPDALVAEIARLRPDLRMHKDSVLLADKIKTAGQHRVTVDLGLPANAPDSLPRTVDVLVQVLPADGSEPLAALA